MTMDENEKLLAMLRDLFPMLGDEELKALLRVSRRRTYPPDTILCHEGEMEDTFYIICDGEVRVTKHLEGKEHLLLQHHGPGEFFGEMALIEEQPRAATVRTVTESTFLEISKEDFETLLRQSPGLALTIVRKVTARLRDADQRAITELRLKNAQLEEQQRLRSEFLTTVAHELRTPLTTAKGYLQLACRGLVQGEQLQQTLETVLKNVETVVHLVNNILFLQELDLITPDFEPVSLAEVAMEALQAIRPKADEAGLEIRFSVEPGLPPIQGDAEGLRRALMALMDNAVKFGQGGGEIIVRVGQTDNMVQVQITDHGVGIPAEFLDKIFEPFTRRERVGGRLFGGLGLGLPLAQHVIQLHQGEIRVESEEGKGSTFTVQIPITSG